jgi:predicted Rossmann fold nucleotide-binding protein DprA/Smf involved in DNA uptake
LIKKGAKLCEGVEDILSEFEYLFPSMPAPTPAPGVSAPLTDNEQRVWEALAGGEEQSTDQVIHATGLAPGAVSVALLSLELKRRVQQLPGKLFVRREIVQ